MRQITVATVQMAPRLNEVQANLERMGKCVEDTCRDQKVDLIVFPELITTGYECGVRFTDLAENVPGHIINYMAKRAADFRVHLAFGLVEKHKVESVIYDSAVLIDPQGELLTTYRKVHLRGEERLAFRAGYRFDVAETSLGPVGLLLGWDLAFPEVARAYALDGADLLIMMANWELPYNEEWRTYLLARAYENTCFVAASSFSSSDGAVTTGSFFFGPGLRT